MAKIKFKIEGLKELDEALSEMSKATARNTLKRALMKAGQPMATEAARLAPYRTHFLEGHIVVSAKIKNEVGNAEYSAAMRAGLGKAAAVSAMRDARRAASASASSAEVYVGPTTKAFYGMFQEFGTARHAAKPFLRPAMDAKAEVFFGSMRQSLADEIEKVRARQARKAARLAAKNS